MLVKIIKEFNRFKKKTLKSRKNLLIADLQVKLDNVEFEILDEFSKGIIDIHLPIIKSANETLDMLLQNRCSFARFGDGEFAVINLSRIHFQNVSQTLSQKLKEVLKSDINGFLIGLPDTFGSLKAYKPDVAEFWRKWMSKKRENVYSYLDLNRVYYNAFFSRVYMPYNKTNEHYISCKDYFYKLKQLWDNRNVVICEGEGTRFGLFNDLLKNSKSISRIICPARNAFDKYDDIIDSFHNIPKDRLVLAALGPTATVLAWDLHRKGYQAIDTGHLDLEYEWFLNKDIDGRLIEFKYVDGSKKGRKIHKIVNSDYEKQIIYDFS